MRNRGNIYAGCRSDEQMYVVMIMVKPMDEHRHIGRMGAVDQVISYIRAAIQSGQYVVGDKLPNEAILAETIGVGRSSLREGMRILAAYGLVEIRQGEGTFITDQTAEQFFEIIGYMPNANFHSFIELRRVVETGTMMLIYNKLSPKVLSELQALVDQLDYKNGLEACVQADRAFHKLLLTCTGNPLLIQIERMIYRMRSELLYKIMCYSDIAEAAHVAHQAILDALKAQDKIRCLEATTAHLDEVTGNIIRLNIDR